MVGHWGLQKCREFLNYPTITDRTMSQLKILIKTHPFTCASYNPYPGDERCILSLGRIIPHKDYGCARGCHVHFPALWSIRNTRCHSYRPGFGCDITAHTVLLYVLFCLIYMYCTMYILYILYTVHIVHVPCFPVEVLSSISVHTLVHTSSIRIQVFT